MTSTHILKFPIQTKIINALFFAFFMLFLIPGATSQTKKFSEGVSAKNFYASTIDDENVVWFLTDSGVISFDGKTWKMHNTNEQIAGKELKDIIYNAAGDKKEILIASSNGAIVASLPIDESSEIETYTPDNSEIVSENVLGVSVSKNALKWFGTGNGISAFNGSSWLKNDYDDRYPGDLFEYFPYSTMTASNSGDSLYVGTIGGGVMRYYKNDVDAVSGASEFAIWGPIQMPSDNVYSIFISPDGIQWLGTDAGVAKHEGHNALEGWTIIDKTNGLADDKVQAIKANSKGIFYFGTANGLSVYDGENLTNYTTENGLTSNNILTISIDKNDVVWIGTDNGVTSLKNDEFVSYQ